MAKAMKNRIETNGVATAAEKVQEVKISPPNFGEMRVGIIGLAPLCINNFGRRARELMMRDQEAGSQSKKGKKREPKNFEQSYLEAKHVSEEGWDGIHAAALRNAMIDACRLCGFKMTHGKLGVFVIADGFDREDQTPLVRITKGDCFRYDGPVRLPTGVIDIRARPMWAKGWEMNVHVRFDADMFSASDVVNLLARAGQQVGIGEGRPCGRNGNGIGWGIFAVKEDDLEIVAAGQPPA